ncbi:MULTISPECIES: hypothetical protein [Subtercola]|uniref:Uncharacterized protein n=1 Tax=Subtercola vilae TaxID=2056433 RepID=A0A4T2BT06_9MICO|nr:MULTISPECIES: hypothetical protein [Subtercola]MEA9986143.1 hypothetical protein [Subtercola sp. RTI3]TIH33571.1 hypothetical protein D4765_14705 [Subtercola vilae]
MSDTVMKPAAAGGSAGSGRLYRRLLRRETHSPKSGLAIVLAVIAILMLVYVGTECVLRLLGQPALLVAPARLAQAVIDAPTYPAGALIAGGIVAAVIGVALVIGAFGGGRRARHTLPGSRAATVVDNEVIASALARHAAKAAHASADNTMVSVSHRTAVVRLTPTSGRPVDRDAVVRAVDEQLASYEVKPGIRSRVIIREHGKVGA